MRCDHPLAPIRHDSYMCSMQTNHRASTIVVSHESALRGIRFTRCRYGVLPWRHLAAREQRDALSRARASKAAVDHDGLARLGFCSWDERDDVHLLATNKAARRQIPGLCISSIRANVSSGLFLEAAPNVIVPSPDFCFIQCCEKLSFPAALALGLELCGTFSIGETLGNGQANDGTPGYHECEASMTVRSLTRTLTRLKYVKGLTTARVVAQYLLDGARSPMEAIVAGVFHPPFSRGGFGIEDMLLNHQIDFDRTAVDASNMPYAICDAYIPSAKATLEYNGGYHNDQHAHMHDERRSLGLGALGISTLPLNQETLKDIYALEAVARILYERKGKRYRDRSRCSAVKRVELLNGLRTAFSLGAC